MVQRRGVPRGLVPVLVLRYPVRTSFEGLARVSKVESCGNTNYGLCVNIAPLVQRPLHQSMGAKR